MLKLNEKQTLTVHNKMELGEDISVEAKGKGRKFVSRFIEPGVAHYEEFGDVLITKETLDLFINTMVGCPVIIQHKDIDDENVDKERVGVISNVWFNEFDGWYYCDGIIWDKQAIDLVKNQDWSVSCTYDFDSDKLEKTHNGKKIDMEFTGGEFLHLALVPNPRYERANIVMNAKDKDGKNGEWITVKGTHVFIEDGQSKEDAVKKFIDGKRESKAEDKKVDKKENKAKITKVKAGERVSAKEIQKNTSYTSKEDMYYGDVEDFEDVYNIDKLKEKGFINKDNEIVIPAGTKLTYKGGNGGADTFDVNGEEFDISLDDVDLYKAIEEKSDKDSLQDKDKENKEHELKMQQGIKDEIKHAHEEKDYTKSKNKDYAAIKTYIDFKSNIGKWFDNNPDKSEFDAMHAMGLFGLDEYKNLSMGKKKEIRHNLEMIWRSRKYHREQSNNSLTEKEITMSVLNELESFIKGVIKNADDEDKKEEVKNEDKCKLIDEVGGILKGKVDDEIIKTIMKKMEEASYEPSEDDKADNKAKNADEEEKEEKFEEEKKIADNKCKNEEEKKEENKKEEDKDEDDEVGKEEVKNKCKNSMKDVKEIIMGGKSKIESDYISKADRFALGEQY